MAVGDTPFNHGQGPLDHGMAFRVRMTDDQVPAGNCLGDGDDGLIVMARLAPPDEGRQRPGMGGYGLQAAGLTPSSEFIPGLSMGAQCHRAVIRKLIK